MTHEVSVNLVERRPTRSEGGNGVEQIARTLKKMWQGVQRSWQAQNCAGHRDERSTGGPLVAAKGPLVTATETLISQPINQRRGA